MSKRQAMRALLSVSTTAHADSTGGQHRRQEDSTGIRPWIVSWLCRRSPSCSFNLAPGLSILTRFWLHADVPYRSLLTMR